MTPDCHKCNTKENVKLKYQITASGTYQYSWYCTACQCWTPLTGNWLSHGLVQSWRLPERFYTVGLLSDNRIVCEICGEMGAEIHHLAPQSLRDYFGETWSKWPKIKACARCHRMWHEITTPYLPGYRDSERAKLILDRFITR